MATPPWNLPENDDFKSSNINMVHLLNAYRRAIDYNVICSITNLAGKIVYVNDKFCEISKFSKEELLGQTHRIINSGFHPKEFFITMWKTISQGKEWHGEVKNKAKDNSFYWVDTVILPIFNDDNNIIQYLSLRYVITEKKTEGEKTEMHIRELEDLLSLTSHKIRGPISTCLGLFNLLDLNYNTEMTVPEIKEIIRHFKSSAIELDEFTQLLTDLLHKMKLKKEQEKHK